MHNTTRRRFVSQLVVAGSALGTQHARAQANARVDESSEQAVALGYHHDTTQVDAKKHPKHDKTQHCGNCQFWQGKPTDPWGGCAMFGRKQVNLNGWCQAWVKAPHA